ncbi:MAG: ribonuclease III [Microcystaceae cyanobacterium]
MKKDSNRHPQLKQLMKSLGLVDLRLINWHDLDLALTHPSFSATRNYEQLEFIGDAVIRLVASEILMEYYGQETVGEFAALRSVMVSDRTLADFADHINLEPYLLQSETASKDKRGRVSRLANSFEGLLGALYLSTHNMDLIRCWLDQLLLDKAAEIYQDPARQNYKDALQEWTQAYHKCLPHYKVEEVHPFVSEETRFSAEVWLKEKCLGNGQGRSKKAAEQAAAKTAFLSIQPSSMK